MLIFKKILDKYNFNFLTLILVFCLGILVGVFFSKDSNVLISQNVREKNTHYDFIKPLLFTKLPEDLSFPEYSDLKDKVSDYIDTLVSDGKAKNVSFYFRNLDSNELVSINPDETFYPASMLKVVTLIATLRMVDDNPDFLYKKIVLQGDDTDAITSQSRYNVKNPIRSGNLYTVEVLVDHLIIESDNVANIALTNLVGKENIDKIYSDLELPKPDSVEGVGYTTKQYSRLFRALYNGTYLSRELSEKVLELLSRSDFKEGIIAGVPDDVVVSHKFGVRTVLANKENPNPLIVKYRELHECGIVYYPSQPYFICVMTRGNDFVELENILKNISQITWEEAGKILEKNK